MSGGYLNLSVFSLVCMDGRGIYSSFYRYQKLDVKKHQLAEKSQFLRWVFELADFGQSATGEPFAKFPKSTILSLRYDIKLAGIRQIDYTIHSYRETPL